MINSRKFCKFTIFMYAFDPSKNTSNSAYIEMSLNDIDDPHQIINIETYCHPARVRLIDAILKEYTEKQVPVTLNFVYKIISYETLPELKGLI